MEKLIETLEAIAKNNEQGGDLINTLNVIANLMFELAENRLTSAEYKREFQHGRLGIDVKFSKLMAVPQ